MWSVGSNLKSRRGKNMAIYGTCQKCGGETRNYGCLNCTQSKNESLESRLQAVERERDEARAEAERLREHLKRKAVELCPDYPSIETADAWECIWAITSSLEGSDAACKDWVNAVESLGPEAVERVRDHMIAALAPSATAEREEK
jgi:hypothetical protein